MKKLNKQLTRDFLQSHGIKFDGAFWINENCPFRLTASNVDNTWMVTIPDLPIGVPQPEPIHDYSGLLKLYLSMVPYYIQKCQQGLQFKDAKDQGLNIVEILERYFSFDKKLAISIHTNSQNLGLSPGNNYTYTILMGNEDLFRVSYDYQSEYLSKFEFFASPECISLEFVKTLILDELKLTNSDDLEIHQVYVVKDGVEVPFFGVGIKFN